MEVSQYENQNLRDNSYYQLPNVLQLRLDTSEILSSMQKFLSGELIIPETSSDGTTKIVIKTVGDRICNKKGVQTLLNITQGIVNSSVVQGNYTFEMYQNHLNRIHVSLSRQILANYIDWEMKYSDLELTIDFIMNLIEPFMSRLIDNKERESYDKSLRSIESSRVEAKSGWQPFGGRKE